jgi:hypothetical protein
VTDACRVSFSPRFSPGICAFNLLLHLEVQARLWLTSERGLAFPSGSTRAVLAKRTELAALRVALDIRAAEPIGAYVPRLAGPAA